MKSDLKVVYPLNAVNEYGVDPASIINAQQGNLSLNLHGKIFEIDDEGQIELGLASQYRWEGNSLIVEFSPANNLSNGRAIQANDIVFSIKRLILLDSGTHSRLSKILIGCKNLKSINDDCEGIQQINDSVKFTFEIGFNKHFCITALASIDSGVIVPEAVDSRSLKIKDYSLTTGAFYVESSSSEIWILRANKKNYYGKLSTFKTVTLVDPGKTASLDYFLKHKEVDLLSTISNVYAYQIPDRSVLSEVSIHKTGRIKLFYLIYSFDSIRRTSPETRFCIADKFLSLMFENERIAIDSLPTIEFIQETGFGTLTVSETNELKRLREAASGCEINESTTLFVYPGMEEFFEPFKRIPGINLVSSKNDPMFSEKDLADIRLLTTDTSFSEDSELIIYNLSQKTFSYSKDEDMDWIKRYLSEQDQSLRRSMFQDLIYKGLKEARIVPLVSSPYLIFARKGLNPNLSKFNAATLFFKVRNELF